ncbi:MAG: Amuc_1100 family pilus-like protein [Opitutales bacterium]|nr:Amuc_1100 family pilus-like protein [Opitutales bacterium]
MKNFKNHPVFTVIFALLLCAFAAGAVYDFLLYKKSCGAAKETRKVVNSYETAINNAPTDESLEKAKKNVEDLRAKRDSLYDELSPDSSKILKPSGIRKDFELVGKLRSQADKWANQAAEKGISVPENYKFSFENYISNKIKPSEKSLDDVWRQAMILDNILQKLYNSKPENAPMSIISVQREPLAEEASAVNGSSKRTAAERRRARVSRDTSLSDTFEVDQYISAKKDGSVSTQGFRIVFTGYTENMRRFLNELNKFDLMLVVRSVEVKPHAQNVAKRRTVAVEDTEPSAADFGGGSAADESEEIAREPVVSENVSEFTFVIEYVEVDKNLSAAANEKSGEGGSEEKAEE